MGKKKQASNLGRSIIRDRFGSKGRRQPDSHLHTSEIDDGYDWNKINLRSVTEESSLDEFLATAQMAGTDFTAEKLNIKFVSNESRAGLLSPEEISRVHQAQEEHRQLLSIPRRPGWDENTTAAELDMKERECFLEWRRKLALLQDVEGLVLTPFERNLDFWRQLWRVIERSDVIVQIVDARNPLLFRSEDLEKYVLEVEPTKLNMILVNKADYLTQKQREMWTAYFDAAGVRVAFWSAVAETERLKEEAKAAAEQCSSTRDEGFSDLDDENVSSEESSDAGSTRETIDEDKDDDMMEDQCAADDASGDAGDTVEDAGDTVEDADDMDGDTGDTVGDTGVAPGNADGMDGDTGVAPGDTRVMCDCEQSGCLDCEAERCQVQNVTKSTKTVIDSTKDLKISGDTRPKEQTGTTDSPSGSNKTMDSSSSRTDNVALCTDNRTIKNDPSVLDGPQLIELFRNIHKGKKFTEGTTTLGMVGYPNVGKSSTINALLTTKKVPVSATPGRTKHFQTLYLEKTLMMCDCPGLVMPTFVNTKAHMVLCGILPIDQMRDYVAPIATLSTLIPRRTLENTYGIMIPKPREGEDEDRPPTPHELLAAYGYMRGYMTHKGIPDYQRSSRHILKDFVNGKLLYCTPPPDCDVESFCPSPDIDNMPKIRAHPQQKPIGSRKMDSIKYASEVDKAFFNDRAPSAGTLGIKKVTPYTVPSSTDPKSSQSSIAGKPWKKHGNHSKKEKLRRLHSHLDA